MEYFNNNTTNERSFLELDNIYELLHFYYIHHISISISFGGMEFKSDEAKDEKSLNAMYLGLYGVSRDDYIMYELCNIRTALYLIGEKYIKGDYTVWRKFVDEYMEHISLEYPSYNPIPFINVYMDMILDSDDNLYDLITKIGQYTDDFLLKALGLLLEGHPAALIINNILGETVRN